MDKNVSIIIPVYNEAVNIPLLYDECIKSLARVKKEMGYEFELIFINDGSTDGSENILAELASDPRVIVVNLARNSGQTAAMMAGFDTASGTVIIPMDGDLQNNPDDIMALLAKLEEGYDVVSGWRKDRQDNALKRNLPSRIANKLISHISGVPLHDYGCSLKAYRRTMMDGVRLYGEMHRFIPIYASWQGAKVTEISVSHRKRVHGQSKYGLERTLKVILDLCVIKYLDKYLVKPIYIFGGFGFFAFVLSFVALFIAISLKIFAGMSFVQTPLPLLSGISFLVGFISILMGLQAEVLSRAYFEGQGRKSYKIKSILNARQASKD